MNARRRRSTSLISLMVLVGVLGMAGCGDGAAGEGDDTPGPSEAERDAGQGGRSDGGGGSEGGGEAPDAGEGEADAGSDAALPDGGDEDLDGGDNAPDADAGPSEGGDEPPDGGGDDYEPVSPAASMATGRAGHAAVLLEDGRVVVMGGKKSGDTGPKVEIFAPASETWSAPAVTDAPDYPGSVAHLLSSGEVAVTELSLSTNVYFYNPKTGAFRAGAYPSHATTAPFGTLLLSGRALTAGGYTTGGTTVASAQRYEPDANQWASMRLREPRRAGLASPIDEGYALVTGGRSGLSDLFSAEIVDTTTGESFYRGSPRNSYDAAEFVLLDGGDLLMAGGRDSDQESQHHVERYSYSTGRFGRAGGGSVREC